MTPQHHRCSRSKPYSREIRQVLDTKARPPDCTFDRRMRAGYSNQMWETFMNRRLMTTAAGALLLVTAEVGEHVSTDYDRAMHFSQYKTYSWEKVQTQDPLWVERIKTAGSSELTQNGFAEVASGGGFSVVAVEMTA